MTLSILTLMALLSCSMQLMMPAILVQAGSEARRYLLRPVDEAAQDPEFVAFRDRLATAVRRRDAKVVLELAAPQVRERFVGSVAVPREAFVGSREHVDWVELEKALALGGAFTTINGSQPGRREFCAPYTYAAYPGHAEINGIVEKLAGAGEYSASEPWVVLGVRVPVRSAPAVDARVMGYVTHELVMLQGDEAPASPPVRWRKIVMPNGHEGWIAADQIRAPTDYHACFARIDGQWQMTEFSRDRAPRSK